MNVVLQIVNFVTFFTDTLSSSPQPGPIVIATVIISLCVALLMVLAIIIVIWKVKLWKMKQVQYLVCMHVFVLQY